MRHVGSAEKAQPFSFSNAVEVIPGRLYWTEVKAVPSNTQNSHFFSIDKILVYDPFFADFGPLHLGMIWRYCKMLDTLLADPRTVNKRIVHCCSQNSQKRANAACLICAYQVLVLERSAEEAFDPFRHLSFLPFRDATRGECTFNLTIEDCLLGLQKSVECHWFDWRTFDVFSYEYFGMVEVGDMNWIIPGKFIAFSEPCDQPIDSDGYPALTPEGYADLFKKAGVTLVVRLTKKSYDKTRFINQGIKHVDLEFRDGSVPPAEIINKFLCITEREPGAIAVHCKAGLGRTGTLIGLYAMKHYKFPARAFIAWNRICRPGSILGLQQQFLCAMESDMFKECCSGELVQASCPQAEFQHEQLHNCKKCSMAYNERGIAEFEFASGQELQNLNLYQDVGQGDRLCSAKRIAQGRRHGGHAQPMDERGQQHHEQVQKLTSTSTTCSCESSSSSSDSS